MQHKLSLVSFLGSNFDWGLSLFEELHVPAMIRGIENATSGLVANAAKELWAMDGFFFNSLTHLSVAGHFLLLRRSMCCSAFVWKSFFGDVEVPSLEISWHWGMESTASFKWRKCMTPPKCQFQLQPRNGMLTRGFAHVCFSDLAGEPWSANVDTARWWGKYRGDRCLCSFCPPRGKGNPGGALWNCQTV